MTKHRYNQETSTNILYLHNLLLSLCYHVLNFR